MRSFVRSAEKTGSRKTAMTLKNIFTPIVVAAVPDDSLAEVARGMLKHNVGTMVIVDDDRRPVGMVTDRDLVMALAVRELSPKTQVRKVMSPHVLAVVEDMSIDATTRSMKEHNVRRLPVVDKENRVVGIVTLDDLLRYLVRELQNLVDGIGPEMEVK
jgi:CBS domain-containing protein